MKLKIGITCYPTVGGSGVIATELGKKLAEKGHEIHFITSSMPFRLKEWQPNIFFHEVQVNQYSVFKYPPYDLTLASKMAEVATREGLDLLHVHYAIPHAISAFLAKQMVGQHLKIVTTLHGTDITVLGNDPSLSEMIRFGIEQSDIVTAVSKHLIAETNQLLQTNKPIVPIYNFVDEQVFQKITQPPLRAQFGIEEDEKVLIHISNFRKVKRVPDVIEVFSRLSKQIKAKLILIGDGPEKTVVCKMVKDLGLDERVLFLGNQENVAELLSLSDLNLLLSEKESFGLVILEAMACGLPSIGTHTGGIPEVVQDGKTGYLVQVGDIEDITEKSLRILQNDELRSEMAANAYQLAQDKFHSSKIVEAYESVYENLFAKHR